MRQSGCGKPRRPPLACLIAFVLLTAVGCARPAAAQSAPGGEPNYAMGALFVPEATYRSYPMVQRYRGNLPPRVDLSPRFPPVGDQGKLGTCVSWAVGYAARSYVYSSETGAPFSDTTLISPTALHALSHVRLRREAKIRDCQGNLIPLALDMMQKHGAMTLAALPYSDSAASCNAPPSPSQFDPRFRIRGFKVLRRLDDAKSQLHRGHPVIFSMRVPKHFMKLRRGEVFDYQPRRDAKLLGGHAMTITGYDDLRKFGSNGVEKIGAFKIINSWGSDWSDHGYGWISYDTFRNETVMKEMYAFETAALPRPAPTPAPEPVRPAPEPKPDVPDIGQLLSGFECADVELVEGTDPVMVTGYLQSEEDLKRLKSGLHKALPDRQLRVAVDVRPWPQCEALQTLRGPLNEPAGLQVSVDGRQSARLKEGDLLVVRSTSPDFAGHLYLSYIQADGSVVHLVQPRSVLDSPVHPAEQFVFGDGLDGRARFRIAGPFGPELLLAVASASPLFDEPRPRNDTDRDYLTALRQALALHPPGSPGNRRVSAAVVPVITSEGGSE